MKNKIKELYLKGYSAKEIADELEKNLGSVKMFINRNLKEFTKLHKEQSLIKRDLEKLDKLENIKRLYLKGYNAKEIAQMLELTHGHIRNVISENFRKEYGFEHRKSRDLNKSIIKSIDRINNSYISNMSFLKQNRQSYMNNKNNNLEFDETRGARTSDVPKKFYNRNVI